MPPPPPPPPANTEFEEVIKLKLQFQSETEAATNNTADNEQLKLYFKQNSGKCFNSQNITLQAQHHPLHTMSTRQVKRKINETGLKRLLIAQQQQHNPIHFDNHE